ncbi:MAG: spore maturation protein [Mollicutes bacterium]|jgi:spore maturation protein B|nr:spore maturation protein [Mollicutes bacterium]
MATVSFIALPLLVFFIVFYGFKKKINIYDEFLIGAKNGLSMTVKILPNIVGMLFAINILIKSNLIHDLFKFLQPFLENLGLSSDILPMCFLRSISGSSTLAIMSNIFKEYGPDSTMGLLASVIQGSSDTTLYVIALYYASVGINKNRYALSVGLFSDLCGIIVSFLLVYLFF